MIILKALLLGIVEGVTEFLPVSSTGHLIVVSQWVDYPKAQAATFDIFIQLGAILAVVYEFRVHLFGVVRRAPTDASARGLIGKMLVAFLPAAVVGLLFHQLIEVYLFTPFVVALSLIAGGIAILIIDRQAPANGVHDVEATKWWQAWWVGVAQVVSMIPGVSRAGATIIGGLLVGLDRPTATRFSFYLSIPTLTAASLFALLKNFDQLTAADIAPLTVGFVTAFVSALLVVRVFIRYVERHAFTVFGYYRIALGLLILLIGS